MGRSRVVRYLKKLPQNNFKCKILEGEQKGSLFVICLILPSMVEKNRDTKKIWAMIENSKSSCFH